MNDLEYRYFYEVARTLNFSQAAEHLYITQPALSRCISKLEQEFQTPLFVRDKRDVYLTNAGAALLQNYPLVQKANLSLHNAVQEAAMGLDSRLTIGIQEGHLITPDMKRLIQSYGRQNPNVKIQIVSLLYNSLFDQLNSHEIDFALALDFPNNISADIERRVLSESQSYVLISRDHPAARCGDRTQAFRLLDGLDLMLVEWTIVPNVTSFIVQQCTANGFHPANIHYAPGYFTLNNWLIMEKGFVIMNRNALFSESDLCYIPLEKESCINFCAYWHRNATNPAALKFAEYLEGAAPETGTAD